MDTKNRQTIDDFYGAFARLDADGMAACYAEDAMFDDAVFSLRGKREVMGMWRMLCDAVKTKGRDDWRLEWRDVHAEGDTGQAHWDAHYRFSATGRMVLNRIDAEFHFDPAGRIDRHRDTFDFWAWSRQALGAPGLLLGWTPMLRSGVRRKADANLRRFLAHQGAS
jgi:ketosteroid isomerase-like protein